MSEAELHLIKQRLIEAMRAKAKRGELQRRLPAGYIWDEEGKIQKDPDERVRTAVELVFRHFQEAGTIHQTHLWLIEGGIEIPVKCGQGDKIRWGMPDYGLIRRMLKNPIYGGAYVYGRRQVKEILDNGLKAKKKVKEVGREQWHVLIKDHHEGYILWEHFEKNIECIKSNSRCGGNPGAPREGNGLLQGLIFCGRCGRRMSIAYGKGSMPIRYRCAQARKQKGEDVCQSIGARRLEKVIEKLLLDSISPIGMDAMIEASKLYKGDMEEKKRYWEQRIERAEYEVGLSRRQYNAVDPENRLVARELEKRYEKALRDLELIKTEANANISKSIKCLTNEEEELLRKYADNIALLWNAPTTQSQDRKRIARCLIENIVVTALNESNMLKVEVNWKGGESVVIEVPKGKSGIHHYVTPDELIELVKTLASEFSDKQIAKILRRKRIKTPKGLSFMSYHVYNIRRQYGIPQGPEVPKKGDNIYTAEEAAELLEVSRGTVIRWVEAGLLRGTQVMDNAPWRIMVTQADEDKLKPTYKEKEWLPLKAVALKLGVNHQTVLQKVKSGELEAVRVQTGRRTGWRIRLPVSNYDDQPTLF